MSNGKVKSLFKALDRFILANTLKAQILLDLCMITLVVFGISVIILLSGGSLKDVMSVVVGTIVLILLAVTTLIALDEAANPSRRLIQRSRSRLPRRRR